MLSSPDPIDAHVGARLRYRRMLIGMSQETLGARIGLTFQQIQKYEKGQNRMGASRLYRVAEALGVPAAYFFEGLPPTDGTASERLATIDPMRFVADPEGVKLNLAFQQVEDPATRRKIVDLVEALARAAQS